MMVSGNFLEVSHSRPLKTFISVKLAGIFILLSVGQRGPLILSSLLGSGEAQDQWSCALTLNTTQHDTRGDSTDPSESTRTGEWKAGAL